MSIYAHILAATDSMTNSADAFDAAKELAESEGAKISLLYAVPSLTSGGAHLATGEMLYQLPSVGHIEDRMLEVAKERIARAIKRHDLPVRDAEVTISENPAREIVDVAIKKKVDLLVVPNDNQQAAEIVANAPPCDVLAVNGEGL